MKIHPQIPSVLKSADVQDAIIHWASLALMATVTVTVLASLFFWVFRTVIIPTDIGATQITAGQKKVNKTLLDAIVQFNLIKQTPLEKNDIRDPFSP